MRPLFEFFRDPLHDTHRRIAIGKVAEHHSRFVADLIFKQSESGRGFVCRVTGVVCTPRYLPPPPPRRRPRSLEKRESRQCVWTLTRNLPSPFLSFGRPSCWEETRPAARTTVTWPSRGLQGHDGGWMLVFLGWKPREREGGEFRWRSKLRRGVLLPKGLTRRGEVVFLRGKRERKRKEDRIGRKGGLWARTNKRNV